ncbi:MAG: formate/nitrite transporter family protein [Puniceicoccaceae bacterium 5H]|nr:MAG: formate/nitrite transporter family protein [Puniceicoccaceae bacterium 5H]
MREERLFAAPSAASVYQAVYTEGENELHRPVTQLFWSALGAGIAMGFSFVTEAALSAHLPETSTWPQLITKFGYCIGFLLVILGRQQLFTENTITPVLPLFKHCGLAELRNVARLWATVLFANLVGAFCFAAVVHYTQPMPEIMMERAHTLATHVAEKSFARNLVGGVFAGWLIASLVWLLPFAGPSRVPMIIIVTYVIGLGSFSHVVAGFVETSYAFLSGEIGLGHMWFGFFLPTLTGNILGGTALVAAINHGQAAQPPEEA